MLERVKKSSPSNKAKAKAKSGTKAVAKPEPAKKSESSAMGALARSAKKIVNSLRDSKAAGLEIVEAVRTKVAPTSAKSNPKVEKSAIRSREKEAAVKAKPLETKIVEKAPKDLAKKNKRPEVVVEAEPKVSAKVAKVSVKQPASKVAAKSKEAATQEISEAEMTPIEKRWNLLFQKGKNIKAKPYDMSGLFTEESAIQHKVLGWGYVLSAKADRIEVLFRNGIKTLIMGYKKSS